MIDSVLKGSGNSRFLKSAVPAGTSWADALAMLQAGTFPIDFNGINTEGFQQVGTPLNKANLLKDATAAQIGLPPSTTPDGMFQALGNTGELHVWRKTVTTAQEIPAGYTLGDVVTGSFFLGVVNSGNKKRIYTYATSPKVGDDGTVYIDSTNTITFGRYGDSFSTIANTLPGKFVIGTATDGLDMTEPFTVVFYIPSDAQITDPNNTGYAYVDKYQPVTGYAKVPAGTTTTYPVSTNPKAYQEGDDAKAAGYVVGDVVTGSFSLGTTAGTQTYTYDSTTSLDVGDDGTVSLQNPSSGSFGTMGGLSPGDNLSTIQTFILGKFVRCTGINTSYVSGTPDTKYPFNVVPSDIVYIPSNANVTKTSNVIYIDRYQPVTGYPAIPAGTTIEYLGKLGDKARVQVVSYVGTGTYGSSNPNSLTFDFVPKVIVIQISTENSKYGSCIALNGSKQVITYPSTDYASEFSWNKKTVSWYNQNGGDFQLNKSNAKYTAIAIG